MRTPKYLDIKEIREDIPVMPPDLALYLTLIRSNFPCLEHTFVVPKVFEPLIFYCRSFLASFISALPLSLWDMFVIWTDIWSQRP